MDSIYRGMILRRREFTSLFSGTALGSLTGLAVSVSGCAAPRKRTESWAVTTADDDKLVDREALRTMADRLATSGANIHSILVVRQGNLVFERYFTGKDEVPVSFLGTRVEDVTFDAHELHSLKSVSKSVSSLVVGIAIDQGLIRSLDEPILSFFPELADIRTPERDRLLLRHALGMTLGLQWVEAMPGNNSANDEVRMYTSGDACRYVLTRPVVAPPGEQFFYNTGALALISAIVRKTTGQPLDEFARAHLFKPLGISGEQWDRIGRDTDAGGGLHLRPRDMARIGQLVLDGGRWNDRQIVSKAWIETSTSTLIKGTDGEDYGYLWWTGHARHNRKDVSWVAAQGRGGQNIRIVREMGLVVVVTAGYYQDYSPQAFKTLDSIFTDVLKATSSPA
ncbi:serine hydrolase domain-containing protein [Paracidovorax anthurii]|nr:serine hydrolase [Paracidovorax anthurii]